VNYQDAELVKSKAQFKDVTLFGLSTNSTDYSTKNILEVVDVFEVKNIHLNDLNADEYIKKYKDGKHHIKVELKNGLKHGRYFEYYLNGQVKITGRYRKDRQVGLWKAYNEKGEEVKRKRF
jgi:antitoxin component YwqK of YwqJK toxin-antitoxin module